MGRTGFGWLSIGSSEMYGAPKELRIKYIERKLSLAFTE
jgi:hypothetical protein